MKGTFLGGAREVGRLGLVLESHGSRILLDYGLAPTDPPEYPAPAPPVDGLLLTHAHLDHAGMVPAVAQESNVPVHATGPTLDAAEVLCRDALKVHRLEGYAAPYPEYAVNQFVQEGRPVSWEEPFEIGDLEVQGANSGHIPGSTMWRVQGERSVLFTGDLYTREQHLVTPAKPVGCDTLVMEATYSGREHPDRKAEEDRFLDQVYATLEQDGTCIIPAFAVGRTQEVLLLLRKVRAPIYLDGMGGRVTELFLRHPTFLKNHRALAEMLARVRLVRSQVERKNACQPGHVIVTTSGMLEGGPVLSHLGKTHGDPRSSVLLTGFQVEGTGGRRLLDERQIDIGTGVVQVEGFVDRFDFSGHSGHKDLVAFAEACSPETIVLCHTEDPDPLLKDLASVARRVFAPANGERFALP